MVANHLIRSVAVTAAKYRVLKSNRRRTSVASRMCLVLDEADHSTMWHQRIAHQRLSRRLELVRQTLCVAARSSRKVFPRREPSGVRGAVVSVSCQFSGEIHGTPGSCHSSVRPPVFSVTSVLCGLCAMLSDFPNAERPNSETEFPVSNLSSSP
jgi:hypothetical protein